VPALSGRCILLVDDEVSQREVVEEVLTLEGAEVLSAGTSEGALGHLVGGRKRPDAVLVDLHGVNAEAVIDATRQYAPNGALLLVSGDMRLHEHAKRLQAEGYLGKPYDIDELVAAIVRVIERRTGESAGASP
jgi:DNA-binding response OmpR family regulator